jgi:hypothetical protein
MTAEKTEPFCDPVDVIEGTTTLMDGWGWVAEFRDADAAAEGRRRINAHAGLVAALEAWSAADTALDEAQELREHAEAEGWLHDPAASGHIAAAFKKADERWNKAREFRDAALAASKED